MDREIGVDIDYEFVERVQRLADHEDFLAKAEENDRLARYPAESVNALKGLGVPGMSVHRQFGGLGHNIATRAKVAEVIAYSDPTTAACMNMHWSALDLIGPYAFVVEGMGDLMTEAATRQAMFCGAASIPSGDLDAAKAGVRFRRVDGGWLGGGRVGYATGSAGADYAGAIGTVVDDSGEPVGRKLLVLFPPVGTPGIRIIEDWDAMGLRGTATNTIEVNEAFVEDKYAFVRDLDEPQPTVTDAGGERQHMAFGLLNLSGGGMQLGHCRHIVDYIAGYLTERKGGIAVQIKGQEPSARGDFGWAQATFGRMAWWVHTAETVLYQAASHSLHPDTTPESRAHRSLYAAYHIRRMTEEVARESFRLAGAHGIVTARPYERMFRDLMAQSAIIFKTPEMEIQLGRAALGREFDPMPGG